MSSIDPLLFAVRRGKRANHELHELKRALHHGQQADDRSTPWTERPQVQGAKPLDLQKIVDGGPMRRGGRSFED